MVALAPPILNQQISAFNIAGLAEAFVEGAHVICERIPEADQSDYRPRMLLGGAGSDHTDASSAVMKSRRCICDPLNLLRRAYRCSSTTERASTCAAGRPDK
jgi:hypothetical protein